MATATLGADVLGSIPAPYVIEMPGPVYDTLSTVEDADGTTRHEVMFIVRCDAPGVELRNCPSFSAMEGTNTWAVRLTDYRVDAGNLIADPVRPFIGRIRGAFVLPGKTPPALIKRWNTEVVSALTAPDVVAEFTTGAVMVGVPLILSLRAKAMLLAMAFFLVNDTLVKLASASLPTGQLIFIRGLLACVWLLAMCAHRGLLSQWRTLADRAVWLRGLLDGTASLVYLTALFHLPLANATAINLASPLFILVLAVAQDAGREATAPRVTGAVTLEVTPQEAEKLDLARSVGTLSLVLRNPADAAAAHTAGARKQDLLALAPEAVSAAPLREAKPRARRVEPAASPPPHPPANHSPASPAGPGAPAEERAELIRGTQRSPAVW
mgnify:CR=1 FL=1